MISIIRTLVFFGIFSFVLTIGGYLFLGESGLYLAFLFSWIIIIAVYLFSEKLILSLTGAKFLDQTANPQIYLLLKELCFKMVVPIPKLYVIPEMQANVFSTGRGPGNASLVFTRGLLNSLSKEEMMAVLGHELVHIKNRDIMGVTYGSAFACAVLFMANMSFYNGDPAEAGIDKPLLIRKLISLLIFLAFMIIKITISERREYGADKGSAKIFGSGEFLVSALMKLNDSTNSNPMQTNPALSPLYIVNPFGETEDKIIKNFAAHPPIEGRLKRLEKI